jgi:hypothetical protein
MRHHVAEEMGFQQEDMWFLLIEQLWADAQKEVAVENGQQSDGLRKQRKNTQPTI